jgi:hypothetical protein
MFKVIACLLSTFGLAGCGSLSDGRAPTSPAAPHLPLTPESQCLAAAQSAETFPDTSPARISVSHILVRHVGSRRAPEGMTRSRGDACLRAEKALQALKQGRDFAELVAEFSDERGAETRAGSIGSLVRGGSVFTRDQPSEQRRRIPVWFSHHPAHELRDAARLLPPPK